MAAGIVMPEQDGRFRKYSVALLLMGALGRILWVTLQPPPWNYSGAVEPSYIQAAQNILWWNFRAWGDRVPVYPLLIVLCGRILGRSGLYNRSLA